MTGMGQDPWSVGEVQPPSWPLSLSVAETEATTCWNSSMGRPLCVVLCGASAGHCPRICSSVSQSGLAAAQMPRVCWRASVECDLSEFHSESDSSSESNDLPTSPAG